MPRVDGGQVIAGDPPLSSPAPRRRSDEDRTFGVDQALEMAVASAECDVYVGWPSRPVAVSVRRGSFGTLDWNVAGPLLKERVLAAVAPLCAVGWQVDGLFPAATRWDTSHGEGGDLYEGCWIRMRR